MMKFEKQKYYEELKEKIKKIYKNLTNNNNINKIKKC